MRTILDVVGEALSDEGNRQGTVGWAPLRMGESPTPEGLEMAGRHGMTGSGNDLPRASYCQV